MKRFTAVLLILSMLLLNTGPVCAAASSEQTPEELNSLYARSAVLMDGDTGRILYGKNENEVMPMASTTKIMTCILTLEMGNLKDTVTASKRAAVQPAVHLGMTAGDQFYLEDLLYALMLESFNDAAVAIAEHIGGSVEGFADLMNQKAKDLGCENTYFITPNGLDESDEQGVHSTTASDLARIMRYCITESEKKDSFLKITRTAAHSFTNLVGSKSFSCVNHNAFLSMMEGALSGKTGFTSDAGYCYVGALKRDGKTFIVALLACGWPNNKTYKWSDTRKLMNYGLQNYQFREVLIGDVPGKIKGYEMVQQIQVQEGIPESQNLSDHAFVGAHLVCREGESIRMLLKGGEEITSKIELNEKLTAPVPKDKSIGKISYYLNGSLLKEYPIVTDKEVAKIDYSWCLDWLWKKFAA